MSAAAVSYVEAAAVLGCVPETVKGYRRRGLLGWRGNQHARLVDVEDVVWLSRFTRRCKDMRDLQRMMVADTIVERLSRGRTYTFGDIREAVENDFGSVHPRKFYRAVGDLIRDGKLVRSGKMGASTYELARAK